MCDESGPSSGEKRKASDDEEDVILTIQEAFELQNGIMEQNEAVLGASDDDVCSYPKGYVSRQALFCCFTCIPESKTDPGKGAAICLACCIRCHVDHDIEPLYTKRNYRCDCGNSKFTDFVCTLEPEKDALNEKNVYNSNFSGVYCTCKRPYVDEEDKTDDTMIQCVICEDWFHSRHLGAEVPAKFDELICEACVEKHQFLLHYDHLCVGNDVVVDVINNGVENAAGEDKTPANDQNNSAEDIAVVEEKISINSQNNPTEDVPAGACRMPKSKSDKMGCRFWEDVSWREELCTCAACLKMYEEQKVAFITDAQDTLFSYEEKGRTMTQQKEDNFMKSLSSLPRVPLLETISAVRDLKERLGEFFKQFADEGKVITADDVQRFFERMKEHKKAKFEQQYYCR